MVRRHLLLSYCFPPDAAPESYLASKFVRSVPGTVDVVTAVPRPDRVDPSLYPEADPEGVQIHRVEPGRAAASVGAALPVLRMPDRLRLHNRRAYRLADALLRKGDHTHLVSWSQWHSVHLVATQLRRRNPDLPWVARLSDPWVDNPFARYGRLEQALNERWERQVMAGADRVIFTSEETRELVMAKYPAGWSDRTRVVPHSFDPELYPSSATRTGPVAARYVGTLYGARRADPLVRAIKALEGRTSGLLTDVRFELVGRIPPSHVPTHPRIDVRPPVDHATSLRLMAEAGLLLVIDAPAERSPFLPSKLVEYLGSGRPILGITPPGPAADLIAALGGWVANPADDDGVTKALGRALEYATQRREGVFGDEAVRAEYRMDRVAVQYERILDEVG